MLSPDGRTLAFTAGALPWWRTSSRGATARSLRTAPIDGGAAERVVPGDAQQLWPQWLPDGRRLLFVSSASLVGNLWVADLDSGALERLTDHTEESVRFPSLAADGSRVAYEVAGEICVRKMRGRDRDPRTSRDRSAGRKRCAAARHAFARRGSRASHRGPARAMAGGRKRCCALSGGPRGAADRRLDQARSALFLDGQGVVRELSRRRREPPVGARRGGAFDDPAAESSSTRAAQVTSRSRALEGEARIPIESPDGAVLVYVRRGDRDVLVLAEGKGGRERDLFSAERIERVRFRPTGDGLACVGQEGPRRVVWLLSLYGAAPRPLGAEPALDSPLLWSGDGALLSWISDEGAGRELRGVRIGTDPSADGARGSRSNGLGRPGGSAMPSTIRRGTATCCCWPGRPTDRLSGACLRTAAGSRSWASIGSNLVEICALTANGVLICRSGEGGLFKFDVNSGEGTPLRLEGAVIRDRRDRFRQAFEEASRALAHSFYDPAMHLKPWPSIVDRYRRRIASCRTGEEFRELLLMAFGELEASHVNLALPARPARAGDGDLGLDLLDAGASPGLLVKRVLPGGPAALAAPALRAGDRILAIDGVAVGESVAAESLLDGRAGTAVVLELAGAAGSRAARLRAIGAEERRGLEEERVDQDRARRVGEASAGRLGYLHLRRCDEHAGARLAEALRPREGLAPEGLVLDLRENRGGFGMDPFLRALALRPWAEVRPRGGVGWVFPAGAWRGTIVGIIDETTSSAAELIALGLRELGLGILVGRPTAGAVIAARELTLADGSRLQLPSAGWYRLDGVNLESRGVAPDVPVDPPVDAGVANGGAGSRAETSADPILEAAIRAARSARADR